MSFELDARTITDWQSCKRRAILNVDWRPLRWRPRDLFVACLRRGIVAVSQGMDPAAAATVARGDFMQVAANPGLDIYGGNPYAVAKEWCVMFETVLRALAAESLLALRDAAPVRLNGQFEWKVRAHADDSGALHRWITVDAWGPDDLSREAHSWYVMGDMAAARVPLTLHVVEIGQERRGRRASPWARAYRNPLMPSLRYRFKRTEASEPVWLVDLPDETADGWVEEMLRSGTAQALVHHVAMDLPADAVCADTVGQMLREGIAMRDAATDRESIPWSALPMSRGACDGWTPCQYQPCCYPTTDPNSLNLYQPRRAMVAATEAVPR